MGLRIPRRHTLLVTFPFACSIPARSRVSLFISPHPFSSPPLSTQVSLSLEIPKKLTQSVFDDFTSRRRVTQKVEISTEIWQGQSNFEKVGKYFTSYQKFASSPDRVVSMCMRFY